MHTEKRNMARWERHPQINACPKAPSFSSSLLDSIYRSIDETRAVATGHRRNKAEDGVESLRRAIMIDKWIDNHSTATTSPKSKLKTAEKPDPAPMSADGRFSKTKTRAQKIYGDLKKAKLEPISPGGKISSFFNSIFSPRNSSMRKSRSMKEAATCSLAASRSCLSKNASSRCSKSKRAVRFCPVSVIVDQGKKDEIIKYCEKDLDDMSCASSDLFELENIGRVEYEQELPLYETTSLQITGKLSW